VEKTFIMRIKFTATFLLILLAGGSLLAQEARARPQAGRPYVPALVIPCPFPTKLTIPGGTTPPAPVLAQFPAAWHPNIAGSTWNQTVADKHFAHTFTFPAQPRVCCLMTKGVLTVTIKALQSAGAGGAASANDAVHVTSGGTVVASQQPWLTTGVTAGTVATVTFPIPANVLSTGMVSFYVQDDVAVVSASLTVEGCCLSKH